MSIRILIASLSAIIVGILLFALQYEYIIIRLPRRISTGTLSAYRKKNITQYYWDTDRWHHENCELVWSEQREENLLQVMNAWFHLMEEQELCAKRVIVQSIVSSPNPRMIYCSFDRIPFSKEWPIHRKWMFIEGLLKTVRELFPSVQTISFLVRHQPLMDTHFDFSRAWPIEGFLSPLQ